MSCTCGVPSHNAIDPFGFPLQRILLHRSLSHLSEASQVSGCYRMGRCFLLSLHTPSALRPLSLQAPSTLPRGRCFDHLEIFLFAVIASRPGCIPMLLIVGTAAHIGMDEEATSGCRPALISDGVVAFPSDTTRLGLGLGLGLR